MSAGTKKDVMKQAAWLPRNADRAVAFPLGGSTFRALLVDRYDAVVDQYEVAHPANHFEDLAHAMAAALLEFGCRPAAGAGFFAGMLPARGLLEFTNLKGWPKVDRAVTEKYFDFKTEWMNDGTAGYYGLSRLRSSDFAVLRKGRYQQGDRYIFAIFGTGLNVGCPLAREDGHLLFVPRSDEDRELQLWFHREFGHWPEFEDVAAGGMGFRSVTEFYMARQKLPQGDEFARQFAEAPVLRRGEVVTLFALKKHPVALAAARKVFENLGSWLGQVAITHVARRVDLSPGILSDPAMREFCLEKTAFLKAFADQGRPMFKAVPEACTIRVCLRNPEHEGATERAAELLRAAG